MFSGLRESFKTVFFHPGQFGRFCELFINFTSLGSFHLKVPCHGGLHLRSGWLVATSSPVYRHPVVHISKVLLDGI